MDDKKIEDHSHAYKDFLFAQNADLRAQLAEQASLLVTVTAKYETAVRIQCQMTELQHKTETQLAEKEKQIEVAVEFIRHLDREYSHYIADPGFEWWRGPQEAGEVAHD